SSSFHLLSSLEPNVLEYLGRLAVQLGRSRVVAPPGGEVTTGHPGCRLVADRLELLGAGIGSAEKFLRLVETPLLHQRPTQHELRRSDVVQEVLAILHQGERVT